VAGAISPATSCGLLTRRLSTIVSPKMELGPSASASRLISSYVQLSSQQSRAYHVGASTNLLAPRLLGLQTACNQQLQFQMLPPTPLLTSTRSITKFSLRKGRRKTCNAVKTRFYRLDWGAWISAKPGRARHLWKCSASQKNRLRHHMFRKGRESKVLDKMVTKYWIKKKWFVDDPYESYHTRDNFRVTKGVQGIDSTKTRKIKKYDPDRKPY